MSGRSCGHVAASVLAAGYEDYAGAEADERGTELPFRMLRRRWRQQRPHRPRQQVRKGGACARLAS